MSSVPNSEKMPQSIEYDSMVDLVVINSAGYNYITNIGGREEIINAENLLNMLWFPAFDASKETAETKERRLAWMNPSRINWQGHIESKSEDGTWQEHQCRLIKKVRIGDPNPRQPNQGE